MDESNAYFEAGTSLESFDKYENPSDGIRLYLAEARPLDLNPFYKFPVDCQTKMETYWTTIPNSVWNQTLGEK